jgi:hypothetical protein
VEQPRARRRAAELANDADLRLSPPVVKVPEPAAAESVGIGLLRTISRTGQSLARLIGRLDRT